ncbi:MAG: phytanoyl-CoA dioxygenase family protein [Pirellulaceae bacterium]
MNDLSHIHHIISDLFQPIGDPDQYRLTSEQVALFHEQGYLSGIRVLDDQQISALRDELDEFFQPTHAGHELWHEYHTNESDDPDQVLFHALGAWRLRPAFHDLLWNPAFTVPASQLLNGAVRFWHDQLFCKPARQGGVVAWHQDYSYWTRTQPMQHLTCWIGLDDATIENGCLQYIPGSHAWELLPITGLAGDMDAIRDVLNDDQWEQMQRPFAVELKAGECTFHHPLMVHGSTDNASDRPRRATVLNVVRDGVCSYSDESLLNGVPAIPKGQPLAGQFFPLLYTPK